MFGGRRRYWFCLLSVQEGKSMEVGMELRCLLTVNLNPTTDALLSDIAETSG